MSDTAPSTADQFFPYRDRLVKQHPCFSPSAHLKYGRIHLPTSPGCNIRCRFCIRENINATDNRPGVSRKIVPPAETPALIERALELCPDLKVVGVAGPGESLATNFATDSLRLIHERHPELVICLSTNGLRLEERAEELVEIGVKTISVTVNAVDPEILTQLCSGFLMDGWKSGPEAADRFIAAQLRGISKAYQLGIVVKVNTVLVPGINDDHIEQIARVACEHGAELINIIPLIPQHELAHIPAPRCIELEKARAAAGRYLKVFRHCQQCRADAFGAPGGKDLSDELYGGKRPIETFSHG
jgi:nitrogen fixation protein NifB